jgi:hypothetical protein
MIYRVSSIYWRIYFITSCCAVFLAILYVLLLSSSDPSQPANIALIAVLAIWVLFVAIRAWRSATLFAFDDGITVRGLVKTTSVPWDMIDHFVAETQPVPLLVVPIMVKRTVLGAQLRSGRTRSFPELRCRPARDGSTWVDTSAARLNELLAMYPDSHGPAQADQ